VDGVFPHWCRELDEAGCGQRVSPEKDHCSTEVCPKLVASSFSQLFSPDGLVYEFFSYPGHRTSMRSFFLIATKIFSMDLFIPD